MLLLASEIAKTQARPRPKWYKSEKSVRTTTGDILAQFGAINWAHNSKINFSDVVNIQILNFSFQTSLFAFCHRMVRSPRCKGHVGQGRVLRRSGGHRSSIRHVHVGYGVELVIGIQK